MSASQQKKSRQEKKAAYMTERQRQEAQDAKKLKAYTLTFWIVLALCVCIVLTTVLTNPVKNVLFKNNIALTVGEHELNSVQFNYYYIDAVNDFYNELGSYAFLYGLDSSKPLNKQVFDQETGKTWDQYFLESAQSTVKSTYALYDLAQEKGFELSEDEVKSIDSSLSTLEFYAMYYGYSDADSYLRAVYGNGSDTESYREYKIIEATANGYYAEYADTLDYTDEDIRNYESSKDGEGEDAKDRYHNYSSLTYSTYFLSYTKWAPTKGSDNKEIEYTEEQLKDARAKAKAAAESLAASTYADLDAFDAAIKALEINKDQKTGITCSRYEDTLYTSSQVNEMFKEWLVDSERKEGDMKVFESVSGEGENAKIMGYYVVRFGSINENKFNLKDVRHILIAFEGGKYNSSTGETTYTDAEKKAALEKAEKLYNEWKNGAATEESFIALVKDNTKDTASAEDGGLYENVYPGQMVEKFEDFCYAEDRKPGDTAIVESNYGYHIMYFVGDSDLTYRDFMIKNSLKSDELTEWLEGLVEALDFKMVSDKHVAKDLVLSAS